MATTIVCPACQQTLNLDAVDGRLRQCPCGAVLRPLRSPQERARRSMAAVCPTCARAYEVPTSAEDSWLRCLCGESFQAKATDALSVAVSGVPAALAAIATSEERSAGPADTWAALKLETATGESGFTFPIDIEPRSVIDVAAAPSVATAATTASTPAPAKESAQKPSLPVWAWIVGGVAVVGIAVIVGIVMNTDDNGDQEVATTPADDDAGTQTSGTSEEPAATAATDDASGQSSVSAAVPVPAQVAPADANEVADVTADSGASVGDLDAIVEEPSPRPPLRLLIPPDVPTVNFNEVVLQALDTLELSKEIQLRVQEDPSAENREDYFQAIASTGGWLEEAIRLAPAGDESIWELLYLLAYCYSQLERNYEAGVLGEHVATRGPAGTTVAGEAALIAFSAYLKAFQSAARDSRAIEAEAVVKMAAWLDANTADNPRIALVRYTTAQVLQSVDRVVEAREWYLKLAPGTPEYSKAIAVVGQLEWNLAKRIAAAESDRHEAAVEQTTLPAGIADHAALVLAAETHLREGISLLSAEMSPGDSLVISKAYLSELLVLAGNGPEALQWLSAEPGPVLAEVDPPEGERRPASGVGSREFAASVVQTQLLAYALNGNLVEAQNALSRLRQLTTPEHFRALVMNVSQQLVEASISQPEAERETALQQVLELVQSVALAQDAERMLLQWAVVTSQEIAEMTKTEATQLLAFQVCAEAADRWLQSGRGPASDGDVLGMQVVRAKMLSRTGQYEAAHALFEELLLQQPTLWELQTEAAHNLQRWADAEMSYDRYLQTLSGAPPGKTSSVWGWGRLSSAVASNTTQDPTPEQIAIKFEVAAHIAECRLGLAAHAPDEQIRNTSLGTGAFELAAFADQASHLDGDWERLQQLYDSLLQELGEASRPLRMSDQSL